MNDATPEASPSLPESAALALWFSAWVSSRTSLDEARDAVVGADAEHHVLGLAGTDEMVPLILAFGRFRAGGATAAGIALPLPGDPVGLAGPPAFNTAALDAGQGVVFEGADLGLVPSRTGAGVTWTCHAACSRRQVPDPTEADTGLRQAVLTAADTLAELDVARWRPEVADELMALRRPADLQVPHALSPRALRLTSLAIRCRGIVELALADDGSATTAREADERRAALTPLDHAARRGLVAACSYPWAG